MKNGANAVHAATGDYPVYPGHPITTAWQIMEVFDSPQDALMPAGDGLNCPAALADSRISGAGGEVWVACELLRKALDGVPAEELFAWADDRWIAGSAGGHTRAVAPGMAQANLLKPVFADRLSAWLAGAGKGANTC